MEERRNLLFACTLFKNIHIHEQQELNAEKFRQVAAELRKTIDTVLLEISSSDTVKNLRHLVSLLSLTHSVFKHFRKLHASAATPAFGDVHADNDDDDDDGIDDVDLLDDIGDPVGRSALAFVEGLVLDCDGCSGVGRKKDKEEGIGHVVVDLGWLWRLLYSFNEVVCGVNNSNHNDNDCSSTIGRYLKILILINK